MEAPGAIMAVLPPLLRALDAAAFLARYFHPPDLASLLDAVGEPEAPLQQALPALDAAAWPEALAPVRTHLGSAAAEVLACFAGLRGAFTAPEGLRAALRAFRHEACALEALYPLASLLSPVSRFFLEPPLREDTDLLLALAAPSGVSHHDNAADQRGGYSLYVPENLGPAPAPLVMALHGGAGHGRAFLWSWLRAARSRGAILIAPTATGRTWALQGEDADTPNLLRILAAVRADHAVDPTRLLLAGMSDGGTFSLLTGLQADSPFTHLAPFAASFHPLLVQMADPGRLRGLPVQLVHGELDWMFPVEVAQQSHQALAAAGARVTYREVEDLSHAFPRELAAPILDWLSAGVAA